MLLQFHQAAATLAPDGISNVGGMLKDLPVLVTIGDKVTIDGVVFLRAANAARRGCC
jgi:hypothetical protein